MRFLRLPVVGFPKGMRPPALILALLCLTLGWPGGMMMGQTLLTDTLSTNLDGGTLQICTQGGNGTDIILFAATQQNTQYAYQWQVDTGSGFSTIASGNATKFFSLVLDTVTANADGNIYRVRIGSGGNQVTSNTITLDNAPNEAPPQDATFGTNDPTSGCEGDAIDLDASFLNGTVVFSWYFGTDDASLQYLGNDASAAATSDRTTPALENGPNLAVVQAIKPSNGCPSDIDTHAITGASIPSTPTLSAANSSLTVCSGEDAVIVLNGTNGLTMELLNSQGNVFLSQTVSGGQATFSFTPITNAVYTARQVNNGCEGGESSDLNVTVNSIPSAQIQSSPGDICEGEQATFTANTNPAISTYEWELNGNATIDATGSSVSFTYPNPGITTITLIVTSTNGCKDTTTTTLEVHEKPVPAFTASPTEVCLGESVSFSSTSTSVDPITSFLWTFGDGGTNNSNLSLSRTYQNSGNYAVTLTVATDYCGDETSGSQTITVNNLPNVISGIIQDSILCENDPSIALPDGTPSGGTWSGPGVSNDEFDPVVAGPSAGHQLTYTYTDNNGCSNTDNRIVQVLALPNVSAPNLDDVCEEDPSFALPDGSPNGGLWSGTGVNGSGDFTPGNPGDYTLFYTFTSAEGCVNLDSTTQTVNPLPDFGPTVGDTIFTVCVNGGTQSLPEVNNVSFDWSITSGGQGNDEITQNGNDWVFSPDENINTPRLIQVEVELTDDNTDCSQILDRLIFVTPAPVAQISANDQCEDVSLSFSDNSSGSPNAWSWDFDDGGTSDEQNPTYTFNQPGEYDVTLEVDNGCVDQTTLRITIYPKPEAKFTRDPSTVCPDSVVTFFNNTEEGVDPNNLSYFWDFGNGGSSSTEAPTFAYSSIDADSSFAVALIASESIANSNLVCRDTTSRVVVVRAKPQASFTIDPRTTQCFTDPFILTNTSDGSPPIDRWFWNDGAGGEQADGDEFTISYMDLSGGNTFTASLTVIDNAGCGDVFEQVLTVDNTGPQFDDEPYLLGTDILIATDDQVDSYQWYKDCGAGPEPISEADKGTRQFYCVPAEDLGCTFYVVTKNDGSLCETTSQTTVPSGRFGQPISQLGFPLGITISPNPNSGKFQMEVLHPVNGLAQIRILNMAGQQVYGQIATKDRSFQSWEVNVPNLSEGMYLLEVQMEGLRFVEKMLVR